jgi:hypothetical protein
MPADKVKAQVDTVKAQGTLTHLLLHVCVCVGVCVFVCVLVYLRLRVCI